jgi:hypothetical protein
MSAVVPFDKAQPIVKQGFAQKRGYWVPTMKTRWFILQNQRLFYFLNQQNPPAYADEPQGAIELSAPDARCAVHAQAPDTLIVVSATRTWELKFKSASDAAAWHTKIDAAIHKQFLYDGDSINVVAAQHQVATAAAVDPRTGVDFRVLPLHDAPMTATATAATTAPAATAQPPTDATSAATAIRPGTHYPDSDDDEIKQRHEFGGRYTEWAGTHVFDDGLVGVPSGVISPLLQSNASLLDSAAATLPADVELDSDSDSDLVVPSQFVPSQEQEVQQPPAPQPEFQPHMLPVPPTYVTPVADAPPPAYDVQLMMPSVPSQDPAPSPFVMQGAAPLQFPNQGNYAGVMPVNAPTGPYQAPQYNAFPAAPMHQPSWPAQQGYPGQQAGWMG